MPSTNADYIYSVASTNAIPEVYYADPGAFPKPTPTEKKLPRCQWCCQRSTDDKYGGCSRCGGPRE